MLVNRIVCGVVIVAGLASPASALADALGAERALGQSLFFDASLSVNGTQSCGTCHTPSAFFTDPSHAATSAGAIAGLAGFRNAPTVLYSAFTPSLHYDADAGSQVGGQFLDGRVNTLEQQAAQPFLNPVEMAMPDKASVIQKLAAGPNATQFRQVFGATSLDNVDQAYNLLTQAIATYERSPALSPFTSKYDAWAHGLASMTPQEMLGMKVYDDPSKGNCAACHPDTTPNGSRIGAMFTDRTYDDIGVPKNPANPQYTLPSSINPDGADFIDIGLGGTTGDPGDDGAFKVPTLRDIDETGPYMHNGYFTTLDQVIDFYNTRDVKPVCASAMTSAADAESQGCWPAPEGPDNENMEELGNLGLSADDIANLEAFLNTLTDGYYPIAGVLGTPELPAWSLMLVGFGGIGVGLGWRRSRSKATAG